MRWKFPVLFALMFAVIFIPVVVVWTIDLPALATYNRKFGSHVVMAYDQATFEGMLKEVEIIWKEMNETFKSNFAEIYCSPWFWEQTYDNSLAAQEDYFRALTERLKATIMEKDQILSGEKVTMIPYNQWYQQTLDSFRNEMKREGGLDWAIKDAWYLTYAPAAYWLWWWLIPVEILLIVVMLAVSVV